MMKPKAVTLVVVGTMVLTGALVMKRVLHTSKVEKVEALDEETERSPASIPTAKESTAAAIAAPSQKVDLKSASAVSAKPASGKNAMHWTYTRELSEFSHLKKKVMMTQAEKDQRARLVQDRNVVRSLVDYLTAPAIPGTEAMVIQNDALDLLLEARASGAEGANEVLTAVVRDAQIENTNLDMETRTALAGVKAEVLYQWSAQDPARASQIESLLPGPVSKKIWRNVQETQSHNLAESQAELAANRAGKANQ